MLSQYCEFDFGPLKNIMSKTNTYGVCRVLTGTFSISMTIYFKSQWMFHNHIKWFCSTAKAGNHHEKIVMLMVQNYHN